VSNLVAQLFKYQNFSRLEQPHEWVIPLRVEICRDRDPLRSFQHVSPKQDANMSPSMISARSKGTCQKHPTNKTTKNTDLSVNPKLLAFRIYYF